MSALQDAVQAHLARQHRKVQEAAEQGEDLPDSFPLDPEVFEFLFPPSKVPAAADAYGRQIGALNARFGIGHYRGCFNDSDDVRHVICVDTPGDVGFLLVLDAGGALLACARRNVERLTWMPFEQLQHLMRTA